MEIILLDRLVPDKAGKPNRKKAIADYIVKISRFGGYLAHANDPPPGNIVMWRGMSRLTDIHLGVLIAGDICG